MKDNLARIEETRKLAGQLAEQYQLPDGRDFRVGLLVGEILLLLSLEPKPTKKQIKKLAKLIFQAVSEKKVVI